MQRMEGDNRKVRGESNARRKRERKEKQGMEKRERERERPRRKDEHFQENEIKISNPSEKSVPRI